MSADIQHADAVKALEAIKKMLSVDPADRMTYADLCVALGRNPAQAARHIGQVTSRVDAACFFADRPFLAF